MAVSENHGVEVVSLGYFFHSFRSPEDSRIVDNPDFPLINLYRVHFWQSFPDVGAIHVSTNSHHGRQFLEFVDNAELG